MDVRPGERRYVTLQEARYELAPIEKLTFPESKLVKSMCGMGLGSFGQAIQDLDGDAWFAYLFVSIRRQHPSFTEADLDRLVGDTPLIVVIETLADETPEVALPDPPALPSLSGDGDPKNGNGSGETIPQPSTLATAGQRT